MPSTVEGIIIVPDAHGRSFWRKAANSAHGRHLVFLGDYGDPFPDEDISPEKALIELEAIISLKHSCPDDITLLLGNHDLQYIWPDFPKTRFDYEHAHLYESLFKDNRDCFQLTASFQSETLTILFSHAGILPKWMDANRTLFGLEDEHIDSPIHVTADFDRPNTLWKARKDILLCRALSSFSTLRGGQDTYGSMVWADAKEMLEASRIPGIFQVFGHTQRYEGPLVTENFACVDCRTNFLLNKQGTLTELP